MDSEGRAEREEGLEFGEGVGFGLLVFGEPEVMISVGEEDFGEGLDEKRGEICWLGERKGCKKKE